MCIIQRRKEEMTMRAKEVLKRLGVSSMTLNNYVKQGKIKVS